MFTPGEANDPQGDECAIRYGLVDNIEGTLSKKSRLYSILLA